MHCDIICKMKCVTKRDYCDLCEKVSHLQNHYVARQKLGVTVYLHGIYIHGRTEALHPTIAFQLLRIWNT